jgi:hypothetical protein
MQMQPSSANTETIFGAPILAASASIASTARACASRSPRHLASVCVRGPGVCPAGNHRHLRYRCACEREPLATPESWRVNDLHLHGRISPVAHAVYGLNAQTDVASEFADSEFPSVRGVNLPPGLDSPPKPHLVRFAKADLNLATRSESRAWVWEVTTPDWLPTSDHRPAPDR